MNDINSHFREVLWKNFGAAIQMLDEVIGLCPETIWQRRDRFYFMAYHTTVFLDYYLSIPVRDFHPPLPYTLVNPEQLPEHALDDVIPNETYSQTAMREWLLSLRRRAQSLIRDSNDETLQGRWIQEDALDLHLGCPSIVTDYSVLEILFYNFRHVQHHLAQLNLMLRNEADLAAEWISHIDNN